MREGGANLFRYSDRHWNPEGHAVAAHLVVSTLVQKKRLPPPSAGRCKPPCQVHMP
jgi:hypothetical protein